MKHYCHLTKDERNEIEILRDKGYSIRNIAMALARSPSTIGREIKRNHLKLINIYRAKAAQHKAYVKRKYAKFQGKKISEDEALGNSVLKCIFS